MKKPNEKPILFNSEMINAILDGRKNMTRRIIKPQPANPKWSGSEWIEAGFDDTKHFGLDSYKKGMNLWVRETWCVHQRYDVMPPRSLPEIKYLQNAITYLADVYKGEKSLWMGKTRPSIFMPRWASRIDLEIIDVRVEKLQDITEADAIAEGCEGIECLDCDANILAHIDGELCWNLRPVEQFENLWDSINKKKGFGFDVNPWCFVFSFQRV